MWSLHIPLELHLILLSAIVLSVGSKITSAQFIFPHFSSADSILAFGDAAYNRDTQSYTINAESAATSTDTCGELLYGTNVRIQDMAAGKVASFSTAFTFKCITPSNIPVWENSSNTREGSIFAFAIVHSTGLAAMQEMVSWSGRSGACTVPTGSAPGISVIFDTDYNPNMGDPSNNYIGVKTSYAVDNIDAEYSHNLCGTGSNVTRCSYLQNGGAFTAWVDFSKTTVQVRLGKGEHSSVKKPLKLIVEVPNVIVPKALGDYVYISLWGSSDVNHVEAHEKLSWSFWSSGLEEHDEKLRALRSTASWVGVGVGVLATVGALIILCFSTTLARPYSRNRRQYTALSSGAGPRLFFYRELQKATKNFSESVLLGSGGFGVVYRGELEEPSGRLVAVKRIKCESKNAETTFLAEISSLSQIRHRNVLQLQGWCHERGRLLLVFDYMANGGLNEWLYESDRHRSPSPKILSWKLHLRILAGVAAALEYLHQDCMQCVLHRDIKSSNVMLDEDFKVHLGDFGLARLLDHQKLNKTTMAAGTLGYMAPELPYTGKATKESDVYSFGILVLEVMCGRRPLDLQAVEPEELVLLYSVWRPQEAGALLSVADPRLLMKSNASQCSQGNGSNVMISVTVANEDNVSEGEAEEMMVTNLLHLGLLCCLPNPKARLSISDANRILQQIGDAENSIPAMSNVPMPPLPTRKPPGLYRSLEFSQTADSTSFRKSPPVPHSTSSSEAEGAISMSANRKN